MTRVEAFKRIERMPCVCGHVGGLHTTRCFGWSAGVLCKCQAFRNERTKKERTMSGRLYRIVIGALAVFVILAFWFRVGVELAQ